MPNPYLVAGLTRVSAPSVEDAWHIAEHADLPWEVAAVAPMSRPEAAMAVPVAVEKERLVFEAEVKAKARKDARRARFDQAHAKLLTPARLAAGTLGVWVLSSFLGRESTLAEMVTGALPF